MGMFIVISLCKIKFIFCNLEKLRDIFVLNKYIKKIYALKIKFSLLSFFL